MLVVCLASVILVCVLAKVIMVPVTISCRDEVNSRRFLMKTGKHDYILYHITNLVQSEAILKNQKMKEEIKIRKLKGG
jgi:hypothetical protein